MEKTPGLQGAKKKSPLLVGTASVFATRLGQGLFPTACRDLVGVPAGGKEKKKIKKGKETKKVRSKPTWIAIFASYAIAGVILRIGTVGLGSSAHSSFPLLEGRDLDRGPNHSRSERTHR